MSKIYGAHSAPPRRGTRGHSGKEILEFGGGRNKAFFVHLNRAGIRAPFICPKNARYSTPTKFYDFLPTVTPGTPARVSETAAIPTHSMRWNRSGSWCYLACLLLVVVVLVVVKPLRLRRIECVGIATALQRQQASKQNSKRNARNLHFPAAPLLTLVFSPAGLAKRKIF